MNDIKKDILKRLYIMFFSIALFAVLIVFMLVNIQVFNKSKWINSDYSNNSKYIEVEPVRGNIYSRNGEILATTMLYYDIRMDLKAEGLTDGRFNDNIDSLSLALSDFFKDKTQNLYKEELKTAREKGSRWHLIAKDVSYPDMRKLKTFPLFKQGRNNSGLICEQKIVRKKPFGILAERTIGKPKNRDVGRNRPIGLEGAYDLKLRGEAGLQFCRKLPGGGWMPLEDRNTVDPVSGGDVYSTIDVELQDVAEDALHRYLVKNNADDGCVILMETKTGAIRAIANLTVDSLGNAYENWNYAIGDGGEPGSTFKLASLMAAFEDGHLDLDDKIDTKPGTAKFYDVTIRDSKIGGYGIVDVKDAFAFSSNTAISKWTNEFYQDNKQAFVNRLYQFGLKSELGIEIPGESAPVIKDVDKWSGVTLPQMSIGYEIKQTPLQTLTFYNAVANNGKMVKPKFVEKYIHNNQVVEVPTEILNEAICSKETINKAKEMLEAVVDYGTAKNLKNERYKIAGKTGTTQLNYWQGKENMSYKASFVGYFPADAPEYSCIVVVSTKSRSLYYGSHVAGPIFKEVADKVYAGAINIHDPINDTKAKKEEPKYFAAHYSDMDAIAKKHQIIIPQSDADYLKINEDIEKVQLNKTMPDLTGMGLKDAVYVMENLGVSVMVEGTGKVVKQSLSEGSKLIKGTSIKIKLS